MKNKIKKTHFTTADLIDLRETNQRYARQLNHPSTVWNLTEQLPREILLHIFSFLDLTDLTRLAYVCTAWRNLINATPGLWRTMYIKLSCRQYSLNNVKDYWYANRFGGHLRELFITCVHHKNHETCNNMGVCIRKLLLHLRPTGLTTLSIYSGRLYGVSGPITTSIVTILKRMLSRAPKLQHFKMPLALWRVPAGKNVLNTLLSVSRCTLQSLMIHGFFLPPNFGQKPAEFDQLTSGILSLNHLTKLGIDYFILNDAFIDALARSTTKLQKLKMFDMDVQSTLPNVTHKSWQNLVSKSCFLKYRFRNNTIVFNMTHYS